MRWNPQALPQEVKQFMADRHLATLSIPRPGQSPHVTPVGFTWDDEAGLARVITFADSRKVKLLEAQAQSDAQALSEAQAQPEPARVSLCQVDGGRWLTLEGTAQVTADKARCDEGVRRYGQRYRPPKDRGELRRVIEIQVAAVKGRVPPPG